MHKTLKKLGISSCQVHGLLKQSKRKANLEKFKQKKVRVLVTTDLSARGLDLQGVDLVFHYNFPSSLETFIHRSGRAARGRHRGETISLITQHDQQLLQSFEHSLGIKFEKYPTEKEEVILKQMSKIDQAKRKVKVKFVGGEKFDKFWEQKIQKKKFQNSLKEKTKETKDSNHS